MSNSVADDASASPFAGRHTQPFDLGSLGSGWKELAGTDGVSFARFDKAIERSLNDRREYRLVTLVNGLQALLISDPKLDKAAVSLSVGVGHLSDPDDLPGLAHFLEHMLFLGTEGFPSESAYKLYLSQHSGSANAFTSLNETNYHLSIHPSAVLGTEGILARHSQFFISPLFLASCTERELKAVDSEFRRNLMLDSRRLFQLGKETSSRAAGAVYWKFGTGSRETLWDEPIAKGVDVRARLLLWFAEEYSANRMKLCVLSTQSLDELEDEVIRHYSAISNANLPPTNFPVPSISPSEYKTEVSYRTIKDSPELRLEFPIPDQRAFWKSKVGFHQHDHYRMILTPLVQPGSFVSHLVGHEGPTSILAVLKRLGWANDLSSSGSGHGAPGFDTFRLSISLTALGLTHYKEVLQHIFAYLDLIRSTTPQHWAFLESSTLGQISWRWKEHGQPGPTAQHLASQLHSLYDREKILVGPYFQTDFLPEQIKEYLSGLVEERCRVFVGSKEVLEGGVAWDQVEKYYGTEYGVGALSGVTPTKTPQEMGLALPEPNPFIPGNLEVVQCSPGSDQNLKRPTLIRQTPTSRLFYQQDTTWLIPRASAFFDLHSPNADTSPAAAVKTQIFASLVEEALADTTYDASLAGLDYSVGSDQDGLQIRVSGYSQKLDVLLDVVMRKIKDLQSDETTFLSVHDRLCRAYSNAALNNPYQITDTHLRHLTRETHWTYEERLAALKDLTLRDIEAHAHSLLEELDIEALVHGNVSKEGAIALVQCVEGHLSAKPADPEALDYHRALVLPTGSNIVLRPVVSSPENVNSAISTYYQVGPRRDHLLRMKLQLFAQIAKVPVFSTLRTKEQLGYIVSSSLWKSGGMSGFKVIIQSEKTADFLDERIEDLWSGFGTYLAEMTAEDFEKQRASLVNTKLEKPKNLGQETSRYWGQIESQTFDFLHRERDASIISIITKDDLIQFFDTYIHPSPTRAKLSIQMRSQRLQPDALISLLALLPESQKLEGEAFASTKPFKDQIVAFFDGLRIDAASAIEDVMKPPTLPEGVVEIQVDEIEAFRKTLKRGEKVVPFDDFSRDVAVAAKL
ncbi:insulysin, partial [Phenoliferia sp. Uapishka_3]